MFLVHDPSLAFSGLSLPSRPRDRSARILMDNRTPAGDDDPNREPARLVAAMAAGDRNALARLYDLHAGPIYSLATRLLGDAAEAQDVVQEIFLQVWRTAAT